MNDLRTAAQQALNCLNGIAQGKYDGSAAEVCAALRAALAQQDEPVTKDMKSAVRWAPSSAYWSQQLRGLFGPDAREGIDALERRLAEAQQAEPVEPVAEVFVRRDGVSFAFWLKAPPPERTKLYTAPPQRKPLTEDEIDVATAQERDALLDHIYEYGTAAEGVLERIRKLCRATEQAHGIGEQP